MVKYLGKKSCGIGMCSVLSLYANGKSFGDREFMKYDLYPVRCWQCIEANNKIVQGLVQKPVIPIGG